MGLILCSNREVKHPYYIEELGIHIYSIEELCYIIYEYPMLVMDGFVTDKLKTFLTDELGMGMFIVQNERGRTYQQTDQEFLLSVLEYSGYLSQIELSKYRSKIAVIARMTPTEYLKSKGDFLFGLGKYGKAVRYYRRILKIADEEKDTRTFIGKVYNNLGSAYANLFLLDDAYQAFDAAYELTKSGSILREMYFLSFSAPTIELRERYQSMVSEQQREEWGREYESILQQAREDPGIDELREMFGRDSVKRGRASAARISVWKQDYRNML